MFWNLKDQMRRAHITTAQLAKIAGISESAMSKKLNGHFDFQLEEVKKIVSFFPGCTWDYLFNEKAGPEQEPA